MAWIVQAAVLFALPVTRAVARLLGPFYGEKGGLKDVVRGESVPSRELIYPPDKAYLKMIFLFPRWDQLVPWRVSVSVRKIFLLNVVVLLIILDVACALQSSDLKVRKNHISGDASHPNQRAVGSGSLEVTGSKMG